MSERRLSGLAKRFCDDGILSEEMALSASTSSNEQGISLIQYLANNQLAPSKDIAISASEEFGLPVYDLNCYNKEIIPKDIVKDSLIQKYGVMPLHKRGKKLFIAVSDPTNINALDDIKFNTGLTVEAILTEPDKLKDLVQSYLSSKDLSSLNSSDGDDDFSDFDLESTQEDEEQDVTQSDTDDAPVVKFINKMLLTAIKTGASDLHFEPYEKRYRVRFRTDGVLHEVSSPPNQIAGKISARLKVMSKMDIAERRVPQDGRIKLKISKTKSIDFRVNTLPCLFGEKLVLRILDSSSAQMGIDALGYEEDQKAMYMDALEQPQGMILVTGPTGSGKTTTLYAALTQLNQAEKKIITAEDPIEYRLPRINQVQVNTKVGLEFSTVLRAALRQDPDIVLIGEMRDHETAEIGLRAAMTGHMVLSTLHTNDAQSAAARLMDMGVDTYLVASSLRAVLAQRLIKKLCPHCTQNYEPDDQEKSWLETMEPGSSTRQFLNGRGCHHCNNTGYQGRVGIYELLELNSDMIAALRKGDTQGFSEAAAASPFFRPLAMSALDFATEGVTSLDEVFRVSATLDNEDI